MGNFRKKVREDNCQELLNLLLSFNSETMRSLLYTVAAVAILSQVDASCENPKVQASSYTSSDSQVLTHIPFITEFTLTCSNGAASIPLYASVKGALIPVQQAVDGSILNILPPFCPQLSFTLPTHQGQKCWLRLIEKKKKIPKKKKKKKKKKK